MLSAVLGGIAGWLLVERTYAHHRLASAVSDARVDLAPLAGTGGGDGSATDGRTPVEFDERVSAAAVATARLRLAEEIWRDTGSHRADLEHIVGLLDDPVTPERLTAAIAALEELDAHLDADTVSDRRRTLLVLVALVIAGGTVSVVVVERARRLALQLAAAADRQLADARVRALIEHAAEVVVVLGADSTVLYHSPAVASVLGYEPDELDWAGLGAYLHRDDRAEAAARWGAVQGSPGAHARFEVRFRHAHGGWVHLEVDLTNLTHEPAIGGLVVNARDVTDRVELAEDLAHQAHHDALTGLANRSWFTEHLRRALLAASERPGSDASAERGGGKAGERRRPVSVVLVDLDGFKEINDSLGHGAGDEVLVTVAARLATLTRQQDCVARLGGDEFAMVLVGDDPGPLAERLLAVLAEPIELDVGEVTIGGSVGIATAADADATVEQLLRDADVAMYDAKARGKNRASMFEPTMHEASMERLALRAALDRAIARGEFRLLYQPKMRLDDGTIEGFEALIRWEHPERGTVPPAEFIPLAESTGQIVAIGRWVLDEALGQLRRWQDERRDAGGDDHELTMAVNVSVRQLAEPAFVDEVAVALHSHGVDPETVTLELTETMLITDLEYVAETLEGLREVGVRIAVDDYGAGNASIGYLRQLPVDILKIDRSFVSALDSDPGEAHAYLRSITELASALQLKTVAEGIEHVGQLDRLRELGCHSGQGYHLAAPLTPDVASAMLSQTHGSSATRGTVRSVVPTSTPGPPSR